MKAIIFSEVIFYVFDCWFLWSLLKFYKLWMFINGLQNDNHQYLLPMLHDYFVRSDCTVCMYRQGKTSRRKFTAGMMGYMKSIACFTRNVYVMYIVRCLLYCMQCNEIVCGICTYVVYCKLQSEPRRVRNLRLKRYFLFCKFESQKPLICWFLQLLVKICIKDQMVHIA